MILPQEEDGNCMVSISQRENQKELSKEAQAILGEYYPMQKERG